MLDFPADEPNDAYREGFKTIMADSKTQSEKFKEAARALECDDDEARFDERMKKLVKQKPAEERE